MELVAFLGEDKENWGQITALINRGEWERITIVKNKKTEDFSSGKKIDVVNIDTTRPLLDVKAEIMEKLRDKVGELEVALSIASGTGKEHMALISALLSIPVGIRLVVFTKEGVETIN